MDIKEWIELAFVGLITAVGAWFKGEHARIVDRMKKLEEESATSVTKLAVIESEQKSNKEHIDRRFDTLEEYLKNVNKRFDDYDTERTNFFKEFELKRRE